MLGEVIKVESIIWCGLSYTRQDKTYEITNAILSIKKVGRHIGWPPLIGTFYEWNKITFNV